MPTLSNTNPPRHGAIATLPGLLLLLIYPFAVHFGILAEQTWPALLILSLLLWLPPLLAGRYRAALYGLGLLLLLGLLWWLSPLQRVELFYLPPAAVLLLIWWWFMRSLLPGQVALVSRIARAMHGGVLSPVQQRYTRQVTWAWVVVLSLLLVELLCLTLFAPVVVWSLFANFLNYLILATVLLVEFSLRRWFLPPEDRLGLLQFVRLLGRLRLHDLR